MSYLFPFIYLYLHSMTRVIVDGREILIQKTDRSGRWKLSTPIFEGKGDVPKEVHTFLKMIQQLKREGEGMIEIDAVIGTIHWTQEIEPLNFGKEFPHFLKRAQEWETILSQELMQSKVVHSSR